MNLNKSYAAILRTLLLLAAFFSLGVKAEPQINTLTNSSLFARHTGVAILGYDTVAYFTEGKPVKGNDSYVTDWKGAKWKFSSQKNLDLFKADPEKYAPQYGGYCAYGVSQGYLVKVEADQFSVRDGKLYLNYDADVQKTWSKQPDNYIKTANAKFNQLIGKH